LPGNKLRELNLQNLETLVMHERPRNPNKPAGQNTPALPLGETRKSMLRLQLSDLVATDHQLALRMHS